MGIRFNCPNGHKLNVKEFLAGKRGVCPQCGAKFIIPSPTDAPPAQVRQPVGVGQSQSVEIVTSPAPSHQIESAAASPSVIIPVSEIDTAPQPMELPPTITEPPIPSDNVLPTSIVAVQPPLVTAPADVTSEAAIPLQRDRTRRNQVIISLLLLVLVLLLAGVLIWVLRRDLNKAPDENKTAVAHREHNRVLEIGINAPLASDSRVEALKP
jgi:hypothetical protein